MTQPRIKLKKLLPIKEAAEWLGVSPATLRIWDKKGILKATRQPDNHYRRYNLHTLQQIAASRDLGPKLRRKLVD
ncbi:MAG: MerR family DNA-binding transcriptional regulator [Candidatus Vogelbacteria bacterium]|nr:MerR family DNA-binding transcriptional regulator [Candidatus Vogelbacteria bacterium]